MPIPFDPAPTRLDNVIDPAWLSAMLSRRWPDAKVNNVSVVETLITMATKVRLSLDVSIGEQDLPTDICIKGIFSDTGAPSTVSVVETRFYQECAAHLRVNVPPCIYAAINKTGDNGVIVMKDMVEAGAVFCTALEPFNPDQVCDSLDQLALLHAEAWQGSALYGLAWVPRFLDQIGSAPIMPLERLQEMLDGPKGEALPPTVKDAARLQRGIKALAAQVRERPNCLVHGDAHAGNIYQNGENSGLVDWQILQKGEWAQDVAYHIAAVLSPEDRRAHERRLLDHYRIQLRTLGGPDLDAEEAWSRYRAALLYGYFLWAITQKVEPAITYEFVRRLGLAVSDHNSFSLVEV